MNNEGKMSEDPKPNSGKKEVGTPEKLQLISHFPGKKELVLDLR